VLDTQKESAMPAPVTVKVDLGLAKLIEELGKINDRRNGRTEAFFLNVRDDLDSVATIVSGLDNLFVDLAEGYSDRHLVDDSQLKGFFAHAANNDRLRSKSGAPEKLSTLADEIQRYLTSINYTGQSGTGYKELIELKKIAEKKLDGITPANEITRTGNEALRAHPFHTSAELLELVGDARGLIA
jgi:hypothetical protein